MPHLLLLQFRELTMRLAFLLQTSNERMLNNTLSDKVDEYSALVQLLHTAADDKLLSLGLINFDTMEPELPPGMLCNMNAVTFDVKMCWEHVIHLWC
jgi:hypothetical protein